MFSLTVFSLRFTCSWRMTILMIALVSVLINLGCWQISRAHEKQKLLNHYAEAQSQAPVFLSNNFLSLADSQLVKLQGKYQETIFLLDNQHYQHNFGYDVISPLLLENGKIVLVDRGWIKGDNLRKKFESINTPNFKLTLSGRVYTPSSKIWVLGQDVEKKTDKMYIIERVDTKKLSLLLHKFVYPFIIRLNENESFGYVRDWPVVSMPPEKHYGYALQWFMMAFVVLCIYFGICLKVRV